MHKASRTVIDYSLINKIGNIIFGELKRIKEGINHGKKGNQNFVYVPLAKLKQMIKYKAKLVGIKIYEINESHTSKTSSFDLEPIEHQDKYIGRRVRKISTFFGSDYYMNDDVNGALNILRKAIGDRFIESSANIGRWLRPVRIKGLIQTSYKDILFTLKNVVHQKMSIQIVNKCVA